MCTTENRCRYDRSHLRYDSDLTDVEWAQIEPQISTAERCGNRRTVNTVQRRLGRRSDCVSCD